MLACVDVQYHGESAVAACVLFRSWPDHEPADQTTVHLTTVAPYVPGQFYRRELPCILAVLEELSEPVELVVIDGYVWLSQDRRPGLGAHLYEALVQEIPVVGVAKTRFKGSEMAVAITRGSSHNPLFITAAGIDPQVAAENVRSMHGAFRIPTLLKLVDQLARGIAA
jgi:deoxyribonuclease V